MSHKVAKESRRVQSRRGMLIRKTTVRRKLVRLFYFQAWEYTASSPHLGSALSPKVLRLAEKRSMDPNTSPSHSEEELTKVSDANSEQTIKKSTAAGPSQVAQTVSTSTSTPTSQSMKTERTVGATAGAAKEFNQKKTLFRAYQIIWYVFGFIEIVLAFRFVLKLLGANPNAGFSQFVYSLSSPFAGPFTGIFSASTNQGAETTSFFEWSTLVAAVVYIVITWGIIKIFKLGKPTDANEVVSTVDRQ